MIGEPAPPPVRHSPFGGPGRAWWLVCALAVAVSLFSLVFLRSPRAAVGFSAVCRDVHVTLPSSRATTSSGATSSDDSSTDTASTDTASSSTTSNWVNPVLAPAGDITESSIPDSNNDPSGMVADCAGNLWYAERGGSYRGTGPSIDRISPGGALSIFPLQPDPGGDSGNVKNIAAMTLGPDGNVWFTDIAEDQVTRVDAAGAMTTFTTPTKGSRPDGITAGPDGALWVTELGPGKIARLTTAGSWTEFALPDGSDVAPASITTGGDGALWFTSYPENSLGRMTPDGAVRMTPLAVPNSGPQNIVGAPDGTLWFTEQGRHRVARMTTDGELTEFLVPRADPDLPSDPEYPLTLADGSVWVTDDGNNGIDAIDTAGTIRVHVLPHGQGPDIAALGLDGNIWFSEYRSGSIGRLARPGGQALAPQPITSYPRPTPGS